MAGKNSVFVNNSAPSVDDTWLNLQQNEGNNIITGSGQSLSDAINNQRVIGVSRFAANNFYIDSGSANAYVLTLAASMTNPVSSTVGYFVGMTIRFRAGNANTGASTVNVNSAGVKDLKKEDGTTDLAAGDITTDRDMEFRYDGTSFVLVQNALNATTSTKGVSLLPQQITISNNSTDSEHDIDFSAGNAQADDGSLVWRTSALTKQIDASWVAGNNQGGLFTGTVANDTWYHCFAIYNPTTGVADFGFDTDLSAANAPAGFTKKMYRGSILTDGDANILPFRQKGNYFEWKTVVLDLSIGSVVSTRTSFPISTPLGIEVLANIRAGAYLSDANDLTINILSPYNNDLIPVSGNGHAYDADTGSDVSYVTAANLQVMTNTSSQIDYQASRATALTLPLRVRTRGYFNYNI